MLETPLHPTPATAQVGSISREVATGKPLAKWFKRWLTPQRLHADRSREYGMSKAYVLGMLHDGFESKHTFRIAQKHYSFVQDLAEMIKQMGYKAWVYREGAERNVFVVEFSKKVLSGFEITTNQDKTEYVRGYFDAEGSVPLNGARMYVYFCQKNKEDLAEVKSFLEELGIVCGKTHNPSKKQDPNYWRFFVSCKSYKDFARKIGSRDPAKKKVLEMVI